jgi:hypothetical protein
MVEPPIESRASIIPASTAGDIEFGFVIFVLNAEFYALRRRS